MWRLGEKYTNQNDILGMRYIEAIKWADSGKWLKDRIVDFKGQYKEYGKSKPC